MEDAIHPSLQLGSCQRLLIFTVAAVLSLLMHAGIVLAARDWRSRIEQGAIAEAADAVSIELVATDTLEAFKPDRIADPASSPEATAPVAGSSAPAQRLEKAEPQETHEPVETGDSTSVTDAEDAKTRAAAPGEPPDVPAAPAVDSPAETAREPRRAPTQGEHTYSKLKKAVQVEKKATRTKGGITSKVQTGKGTGSGRVSASTGAILAYAALVRDRVAGNRPTGSDTGGTAVIAFGLTSSGALAYARISRSSGNPTNDGNALAAVRGAAPFPRPPAGATPAQLRFTIPYYFQ